VIARILGEGQYELAAAQAARLAPLDAQLTATLEGDDEPAFKRALAASIALVRSAGSPVAADSLAASDIILPSPDASLAEVRKLLAEDGIALGGNA
jgi:predicted transcriptional regulator